ncbi:MAG: ABC transporter ATP-binding protein, partial [Alicyclobacillaceae bacterium]|nr:ABC transporter ATP-binding protein [Alicyclobacillaceae bacterium]
VRAGEVFGLVGESGSGKSTLANLIMGLERLDGGEIRFRGSPIAGGEKPVPFPYGDIQIVFQDPRSSLDPRMRVRDIILEPLRTVSPEKRREYGNDLALENLLRRVGLRPDHLQRFPHEFSGGQRQRIAIARALITRPSLVILDEPTSALDVSVQAQVINLLKDLQQEFGLTYLFISHNMGVVKYFCDRVGVLYRGRLLEVGETEQIFTRPREEYTRKLLASVPSVFAWGKIPEGARGEGDASGV